jgi:hypothetical protein
MPCLTISEARDEIFAIVNTAWGTRGPIQWPDMANFDTPANGMWLRVTLKHQTGGQVSLSDAVGQKRWQRIGTLWMQVFTDRGDGLETNYGVCQEMLDAFQGVATAGGVWFRNTRINEVGVDGAFQLNNVLTQFQYDQIH